MSSLNCASPATSPNRATNTAIEDVGLRWLDRRRAACWSTLVAVALVFQAVPAAGVVFTNDTVISVLETNYEGQDIVISNCTLTVDGPHSFASLRAAAGAVLTHSALSNGIITSYIAVTNEAHVLPVTTPVLLAYPNVLPGSVVVRDDANLVTFSNTVDYSLGASNNFTTLERTLTSSIPDGATVLVSYQAVAVTTNAGLMLTVSGNLEVEAGARIDANGRGMGGNSGSGNGGEQGNPLSGGGAGYGGYGGLSSSNAPGGVPYGSPFQPASLGSGGGAGYAGPGGAGGGLVRLTVNGTLLVNGVIVANGQDGTNSRSGGGSGGSVWITAQAFGGSGSITAHGASGEPVHGGGGGGGRIALELATNSFSGSVGAYGGPGAQRGGAGTVFFLTNAGPGQLVFDNGGVPGAATLVSLPSAVNLTVQGRATAVLLASQTVRNLIVRSGSSLVPGTTNNATFTLTAQGDALFEQGATLSLDARGYSPSQGQGVGVILSTACGGSGHGGAGGSGLYSPYTALGGTYYGSLTSPTTWGSGGRTSSTSTGVGGAGGGAVRLTVTGNLQLDGRISADGTAATGDRSGGGAGGSIWLTLGGFSGSGIVSANGGAGGIPYGGGGGGGRIAITYSSNTFSGTLAAYGAPGAVAGGAGTIFTKNNILPYGRLLADNGGLSGTNTALDTGGAYSLAISNGAIVRTTLATLQLNDLAVGSNAAFVFRSLLLTVSSNATISLGGALSGDGQSISSFGQGSSSSFGSGGGGHGGNGGYGMGLDQTGRGGAAFDFANAPTQSGGPGGSSPSPAPAGGGALQLTVNGVLRLDGALSANGLNASSNNAGGGAGGSLWLTLRTLSGNGTITANGGNGLSNSGGGAGGRIAIVFSNSQLSSNLFTGAISALGGNGFMRAAGGTIYFYTNGANIASVLVDNGGFRATNTSVSVSGGVPFDVTVQNGGVANNLGAPRDLLVRSNGFISQTGSLTVTRNVTIEAGGAVALDGLISFGTGAGAASSLPRGGAGHGGYGALNPPNSGSGNAYGSAISPVTAGSQGGGFLGTYGPPYGGQGGGAIHLTVPNTLLVNGRISANGGFGDSNGGGGSGGSIWLTAGTVLGNGQITVIGGSGTGSAGGGGGGRIAITYNNNSFSGLLSACGGPGGMSGGAGTIYLKNNSEPFGTLLLNNCGSQGTNTPVSQTIGMSPNLRVMGGAVAEMQGAMPLLSNLTVIGGSALTCRNLDPNLYLGVLGDVLVDSTSAVRVDAKGYGRGGGPGAGSTLSNKGSGGGYGGVGGSSGSGVAGGTAYGLIATPVDRGSGGGAGLSSLVAGSEGGGAIRLTVAGALTIDGVLAANGGPGLQDDSGGGSGGSVWITAATITGGGSITANGGMGELLGGGGGAGGRIAIYSSANSFTGLVSVAGGNGASSGQTGTVFSSVGSTAFQVLTHSPSGSISNTVSFIDLNFSDAINPGSVSTADIAVFTPTGPLAAPNLTLSLPALTTVRVSFPQQNMPGDYRIEAGPAISDILGQPLSQVYTGAFTIVLPTISGTVTNSSGSPISGVTLQPSGGLQSATTDPNGNYSLGVPTGWTGTVTPMFPGSMFVPGSRSYTNTPGGLVGEDYLALPLPVVGASQSGTNFVLAWYGFSTLTYQAYYSTNLADWYSLGNPLPGTNGVIQLFFPIDSDPAKFFRISAAPNP